MKFSGFGARLRCTRDSIDLSFFCRGRIHLHVVTWLIGLLYSSQPAQLAPAASVCARFGDHRLVDLGDDSTADLNSGTCIVWQFTENKRLVWLKPGEALFAEAIFQVKHNPLQPFVVRAGPNTITDLGTRFDLYRTPSSTRVTVLEGAVQIPSVGVDSKPLTDLQQLDVPDDPSRVRVRSYITAAQFERMTAWVNGKIYFDKQTLREALEEFRRYRRFHFDVDPRIENVRLSGTYRALDVDSFLNTVQHDVKCSRATYDETAQVIEVTRDPVCP